MTTRFTCVDQLTRPQHALLGPNDACFFLGEYTSGGRWDFSATNNLILNLKKGVDRRGLPEWRYKEEAIVEAGRMIREALPAEFFRVTTLVPVPPSRAKGDPLYDDRMLRVLCEATHGGPADVRELVLQIRSTAAAHTTSVRPSIDDLAANYRIDESVASPLPTVLAIFDDLLTAGAHYRAMERVLSARFPLVPIAGFFLARRAIPASDPLG